MKNHYFRTSCQFLAFFLMLCHLVPEAAAQEYSMVITSSFESKCLLPNEGPYYIDELPQEIVACRGRKVTYTAHVNIPVGDVADWSWWVDGAASVASQDNEAVVTWGNGVYGTISVTITTTDGHTYTYQQTVRLIENPVVSATTVPAPAADHTIYVCSGADVEFTDQSYGGNSDIAGYYWESCNGTATTRSYTLENVTVACTVTHRVYNNCGCYDEEVYNIEVLEGDPLQISCYGTVCEGSTVTYKTLSPSCSTYFWSVDGGQIIDGQGTSSFTVCWNNPQEDYGVISLDGTLCGNGACPNSLSVKIPIIRNRVAIIGQQSVCLGEAAVYSVPHYGSTEYTWSITPNGATPVHMNDANLMAFKFDTAGIYKIAVRYHCSFLGCGDFTSDTLTVVVKPRLEVQGEHEVCLTNFGNVLTTNAIAGSTAVNWAVYAAGSSLPMYTSPTPSAQFSPSTVITQAGRYRITAASTVYCNRAEFILTVKDAPPAPTMNDMDPDNPRVACPHSGIELRGQAANPDHTLMWETTCGPSQGMGEVVTLQYGASVCDVKVFTYDRRLDCISQASYLHPVSRFQLLPTTLPTGGITVCPGTRIKWTGTDVPYQDGVLYEWEIQDNRQNCATVEGDNLRNEITLLINEFPTPFVSTTFNVYLHRRYCSDSVHTTIIPITIADLSGASLSIDSVPPVCRGTSATLTGHGCSGNYKWTVTGNSNTYQGNPASCLFPRPGQSVVTLTCNPYSVCTNPDYYPSVTRNVQVVPGPPVASIGYDGTNVYIIPTLDPNLYSFSWQHTNLTDGSVPIDPYVTQYSCTVTSLTPPYCSVQVSLLLEDAYSCDPMQIVPDGDFDYCNKEIKFLANTPPGYVDWTVSGGLSGELATSGVLNNRVTIPVAEVGDYVVQAHVDGDPCYSGHRHFTVDFLPEFTFERQCTTIVIHNHSLYLDGTKQVEIDVNGTETISFSLSRSEYIYDPGTDGSFTFTLYKYDDLIINCPLETVVTEDSHGLLVTVTTENATDYTKTCDNTPILLTASVASPHSIKYTSWNFGDGSLFDTIGHSIHHTFGGNTSYPVYNVSVVLCDENGCESSGGVVITSNSNELKAPSLGVFPNATPVCTGTMKEIRYQANLQDLGSPAYFEWSTNPNQLTTDDHIEVDHTADYYVTASNDKFCKAKAMRNVAFLNNPVAIIVTDKYHHCAGEEITLYGAPDPIGDYSYTWTVTNSETGDPEYYYDRTVTFDAPAMLCTLEVNLTIVDNTTGCSSTANSVSLYVYETPAAPTIQIGTNPCIDNPPVDLVCTGPVYHVNWSNGKTGQTAYYYYPGVAAAWYYDLVSGCRSETSVLEIPAEPDFDALLTGCYKVCDPLSNGVLPMYGLLPTEQPYRWEWFKNQYSIGFGAFGIQPRPLQLALQGFGTYQLDVGYSENCGKVSKTLTLEEGDACYCDSMEVSTEVNWTVLQGCVLEYTVTVTVCNNSSHKKCFESLEPLFDGVSGNIILISTDFDPTMNIAPHDCYQFDIVLKATSLDPSVASFRLFGEVCNVCTLDFYVDLTWETNCTGEVEDGSIIFSGITSGNGMDYYNFSIDVTGAQGVLAVWSDPQRVVNYYYDGVSTINGLCAIDESYQEVCFFILVCKNGDLCVWKICLPVPTRELEPERAKSAGGNSDGSETPAVAPDPRLDPNPTTGEVRVVGTTDEVTGVLVMDMNGRRMVSFENTAKFSVADLAAGIYIVRINTRHDADSPEHVTYLKLIKR